jgi:hypothetical protein
MKHSFKINMLAFAVASVVAVAGSAALAAKGPPSGGGGGGKKPPVEVSNNLSYPILELLSGGASGTIGVASTSVTAGVFNTNFSYGCPETATDAEYPNKSCVGTDGIFWDKADTRCINLCAGQTIERMYWQKVPGQTWKSEVDGVFSSETAEYVDWGDALESRTVSATSVARVETMPFDLDASEPQLFRDGFEMWHVFGTGKTEMWGARVTDSAPLAHYTYESPYAIIHTGNARLNLAKLSPGAVTCPSTASVEGSSPYDGVGDGETLPVWDSTTKTWSDALFTADLPYSAELNIQGKYVYGYNWTLKTFNAGGYDKAGWWRLTFYADDVGFTDATIIGPPAVPTATANLPLLTMAAGGDIEPAAETEGRLYVARVRGAPDNLTFIDVCISAARGGGGRKP